MSPLIIEFLGTQGSGKTTLMPAVVSFFREQGIRAQTVVDAARPYARRTLPGRLVDVLSPASIRDSLLWQIYYQMSTLYAAIFTHHNRQLVRFVYETQRARPLGAGVRERKVLFWFSRLCGSYTFLNKNAYENEALIFDDGFVHRTVHFNASSIETPQPEKIKDYLTRIPLPDLLIVLRVPLDVCVMRVTSRGIWKHFLGRTEDELRQYLANSEFIVNITVAELRKMGCSIIEVDNSRNDLQKTIADLQKKLQTTQLKASRA